jgi:uncharacterized Zn finger protein (UPF0148 family)
MEQKTGNIGAKETDMSCNNCGYDRTKLHKWNKVAGIPICPQCGEEVRVSFSTAKSFKGDFRQARKEKENLWKEKKDKDNRRDDFGDDD